MILGFAMTFSENVSSKIHHRSSPLPGVEEAEKTPHASLWLSPDTCSQWLVTPFPHSSASQAPELLQQPEQGWRTPKGAGIPLARSQHR